MTAGTCKGFVYGGCGANANNFKNIEECEAACSGVTGGQDKHHTYTCTHLMNVD